MTNAAVEYLQIGLAQIGNGTNALQVGNNIGQVAQANGDPVGTLLSVGQAIEGLSGSIGITIGGISSASGKIGVLGPGLATASALNNVAQLIQQLPSGQVQNSNGCVLDLMSILFQVRPKRIHSG